ncbi:uncharacterized protein LOC129808246 [Phlebotomus papatasi]|uniref:uncharacterized protein LOC129801721 n=1 Tax=Phlebotomus papatasi TaxID=29031 RepID=UPI0024841A74|nr:uncharacterized protein LOC129801721 [Phlebotomus papatasi]XP_055714043.1 uncharacterized protein LOC129808246 [Phlebotomus papatasi]
MDLQKMFDQARKEVKMQKAITASSLTEGRYYHIHGIRMVNTKFGKNYIAELEENISIWLPKSLTKRMNGDELTKISAEDMWELAYLGREDAGNYNFVNVDVRKKSN